MSLESNDRNLGKSASGLTSRFRSTVSKFSWPFRTTAKTDVTETSVLMSATTKQHSTSSSIVSSAKSGISAAIEAASGVDAKRVVTEGARRVAQHITWKDAISLAINPLGTAKTVAARTLGAYASTGIVAELAGNARTSVRTRGLFFAAGVVVGGVVFFGIGKHFAPSTQVHLHLPPSATGSALVSTAVGGTDVSVAPLNGKAD
eukprot:TRINITY_DN15343_c0_g1_i1.p1 TRINITY_DN15343_c0_g1~~TRINITY_DN15343_c0_g1_i1.p1  ORF type:complete len:204 (+),score=14.60 TRINITY_DN15343_c0_g1_i1:73-684(+)